jgi:4-hydroxy-tetrahydrodipicolinate synthase
LTEYQIKKYFEELADAISLPLIIYNIPATTHMSIPLEVIEELSYHPNIVATKDSERNQDRLIRSQDLWSERNDFGHFLGWAAKSAEGLIGGSDGLIPSTGNLVPKLYQSMLKAVEDGDFDEAYQLQEFSDIVGDLYQKGKTLGESLWALKVLMRENGLCEAVVMPPLQPMSTADEEQLIQSFKEIY